MGLSVFLEMVITGGGDERNSDRSLYYYYLSMPKALAAPLEAT